MGWIVQVVIRKPKIKPIVRVVLSSPPEKKK